MNSHAGTAPVLISAGSAGVTSGEARCAGFSNWGEEMNHWLLLIRLFSASEERPVCAGCSGNRER